MSLLLQLLLPLAAPVAPAVDAPLPFNWTTSPARTLPNLNGSAFPRYRQIFEAGECNHADALPTGRQYPLPNGGGTTRIDPNKVCFTCFRIPTVLAGLTPGVVHAFAEGRRGDLASGTHCPDGPDTRGPVVSLGFCMAFSTTGTGFRGAPHVFLAVCSVRAILV